MDNLLNQIVVLKQEVAYLKSVLDTYGIPYNFPESDVVTNRLVENTQNKVEVLFPEITPEHAKLLYSMFRGRKDVFSKRSKTKNGYSGYFPVCRNFWKYGLCPKACGEKIKCSECDNKDYEPLSITALMAHLKGESEDYNDVIGIYPLLPDNTCNFLVYDFDNHSQDGSIEWRKDVNIFRDICYKNGICPLVERSRSGNGAHVWIFFSEPIPASIAREFGTALITKGSETIDIPDFKFYDRMMPMQDKLPYGGLGNLIALPLQGKALKNGNSAFVDENWNPYYDQWKKLRSVRKLSYNEVESKISQWGVERSGLGVLSEIETDDAQIFPWQSQSLQITNSDVTGNIEITLANGCYIKKSNLKPSILNRLRREAAYNNPEFYKKLAMGFTTVGTPRIVYKGYDIGEYLCLPRGCADNVKRLLNASDIPYDIADERQRGKSIKVNFNGNLYPEQEIAVADLMKYDNGILSAATAFGKTVVGAYLIAQKKVNTLVLVRNTEVLKNWLEDLTRFLDIDEELPEYTTPKGRIKRRKDIIGKLHSSSNTLTGIIDVAMITSFGKVGDINPAVKDYGMVIIDECHHAAAETDEAVLMAVNAKYVYGLTATVKRDDGQVKSVLFQIGPVRYTYSAKDRALKQGIKHYVYPRFTRSVDLNEDKHSISEIYQLVVNDKIRNKRIVEDAIMCVQDGRNPIVMTKYIEHAELLYQQLQDKAEHVFLLRGGKSSKERDAIRLKMNSIPDNESVIVVAIGKYIGEGFNYPRLDTLLIAMPIAWEGNVEQYAGRINRDYTGKRDVIIFDYIDQHIGVFDRMYHKRMHTYKCIGYEICSNMSVKQEIHNSIYDIYNYGRVYKADLSSAQEEIIISSPRVNSGKTWNLICLAVATFKDKDVKIHVLTLPPVVYKDFESDARGHHNSMETVGIKVHISDKCHERFAIIDRNIVWYGSMCLLAKEREDDNIIRLESSEIAEELLSIQKETK